MQCTPRTRVRGLGVRRALEGLNQGIEADDLTAEVIFLNDIKNITNAVFARTFPGLRIRGAYARVHSFTQSLGRAKRG